MDAVKIVEWSAEEISILIRAVSIHPILYNNSPEAQSNREVIEKVWETIAYKVPGKTAQKCKEKWRYLKNSFIEKHVSNKVVKWSHYDKLMFLAPYIRHAPREAIRRVVEESQPSTAPVVARKIMLKAAIKKEKPQKPAAKKRLQEGVAKKKPATKTKKVSSLSMLFERIEKDYSKLSPPEQYDFEIRVMTLFRDKLQRCNYEKIKNA